MMALKMRLGSPVVVILPTIFAGKQANQNHADDKSSDVCPPGDSARITGCRRKCRGSIQKLHEKPEAKDDESRYFDHLDKNEDRHQRQNARERIGNEVRSENTGNCATGANAGDGAVVIQYGVNDTRSQPAQQVEYEVAEMAKAVLNVVAEDPEIPHVSNQMQPA